MTSRSANRTSFTPWSKGRVRRGLPLTQWPLCTSSAALFATMFGASVLVGCGREAPAAEAGTMASATPARTPTYVASVVQSWPHDPDAFTQGLVWDNGRLFEGTGQVGKSSIREVELTTGRVIRKRDVPDPYFGEGIVLLGDKLYELTWRSGVAFVYDVKTFEPITQFKYDGEGWGLATDGTSIIMSDGSAVLRWRDAKTFAEQKTITVTDHGTPVSQLNELEWVKGEIWANVWQSDQVARIDPKTGNVTGWIDLTGILPAMDRRGAEDVLNGIAYDPKGDRLFVTGKLWSRLFEITLKQRS